jgi:hypothetical protein
MNEDRLDDLLVMWDERRKEGRELSAEELCENDPELIEDLKRGIHAITAMRPFVELDDDSEDDFLSLPDFSTVSGHAAETRLPECKLSVDEFCRKLVGTGLMDDEQVKQLKQRIAAENGRSFAQRLADEKKLTRFQATVLLEGRKIPLVLDRYVLLDEIGRGGMGAVYKALHQQMDRVVALKILPREAGEFAGLTSGFLYHWIERVGRSLGRRIRRQL